METVIDESPIELEGIAFSRVAEVLLTGEWYVATPEAPSEPVRLISASTLSLIDEDLGFSFETGAQHEVRRIGVWARRDGTYALLHWIIPRPVIRTSDA